MIGHGYIHDDFYHLYTVNFFSVMDGITKNFHGFYTPVQWLSFKLDWMIWGWQPLAFTYMNLAIHLINISLIYLLALKLWCSRDAAQWTALGYSLLYPGNTWAVMWISTRGHLLVTLFDLCALLATLWCLRTKKYKYAGVVVVGICIILAVFSKESGITVPFLIISIILYERRRSGLSAGARTAAVIILLVISPVIIFTYLYLRWKSGAIPISFSAPSWYTYTPEIKVVIENIFRYSLRTFGITIAISAAVVFTQRLRGYRISGCILNKDNLILCAALFIISLSPFVMMKMRSGIYTYLPGIAAALLLGSILHNLSNSKLIGAKRYNKYIVSLPNIIVIIALCMLTIGHSLRWKAMAEANSELLTLIKLSTPNLPTNASVNVYYCKSDKKSSFPSSLSYAFPYALKVMYKTSSIDGHLIPRNNTSKTEQLNNSFIFNVCFD